MNCRVQIFVFALLANRGLSEITAIRIGTWD